MHDQSHEMQRHLNMKDKNVKRNEEITKRPDG